MKKILSFLTACFVLTSCSNVGNNSSSTSDTPQEDPGISAEPVSDEVVNGYKSELITTLDDLDIYTMIPAVDSDRILLSCYGDRNYYCETTNDFSDYKEFSFELPPETETADLYYTLESFNSDLSFFSMVILEDHGGIKLPDEYDENFDYEAYNNNCISSYLLCKYDSEGNLLSTVPFEFPDEMIDEYGDIKFGVSMSEGNSLLMCTYDNLIYRIDENGNFNRIFQIESNNDSISIIKIFHDRDGKTILAILDSGEKPNLSFCTLNDDDSVEEPFLTLDAESAYNDFYFFQTGSDKYRFYYPMKDGLYGVTDSNELEMIYTYEDVSISAGSTINVGKNQYITLTNDSYDQNSQLYRIFPRDPGEDMNVIELTISAPYSDALPKSIINNFNTSQSKYKIKTEKYDNDSLEYNPDNEDLNLAIISGNSPDIIFGLNYSTYLNYQHKGVFADLSPFIESDPIINKNTILPNYLSAISTDDGSVYGMSGGFTLQTLVAKTRICNKESWTLDEMQSLYDDPPVNAIHRYDAYNKEEMLRTMFYSMNELIDYKTATCNFNSDYFIDMLKFCNKFVDVVDMPDKFSEGDEAVQNYWTDRYKWLENDLILTNTLNLCDPVRYSMIKHLEGGGEDLTFVGFPSSNGKGGRLEIQNIVSITESCENKEGAWEFIKFYIDTCRDKDPYNTYGDGDLPVLSADFEDFFDHAMNASHTAGGEAIPNITQEERESIEKYIKSCDTLSFALDYSIEDICFEEAGIYFSGGQTAEEAAEHIQNRASIVVSEKS